MRLEFDPQLDELIEPVRAHLERAWSRLPPRRPMKVTVGTVEGLSEVRGDTIVLSDGLLGPAAHHPDEIRGPLPPLDRWRRSMACILEAGALQALELSLPGIESSGDWRWVGCAVELADHAATGTGLAQPDFARVIQAANPGDEPRTGAIVYRYWRVQGDDPWARARSILQDGVVSPDEWLEIGRWMFSAEGMLQVLPAVVPRVGDLDIPVVLGPWRWQPLAVPPHPRGGRIGVEGPGKVIRPWAPAGQPHHTLAGSTDGVVQLTPLSGGPVGTWDVASVEGFDQIMGARGIAFKFHASGRLEVIFADGFVGPLAALGLAEQMGTSGVAEGRWNVDGPARLRFTDIRSDSLTMHGRNPLQDRFMMPARGFGVAEWLQALKDGPWHWHVHGERLTLRGQMMGAWLDVRLKRSS